MYRHSSLAKAVRLAIIGGSAGAAGMAVSMPTFAQNTPEIEEVIVTGSLIARRDAIAESPILTVDQGALLESGYTTIEQYLNTLPQVTPNLSSQSNNPSGNGRAVIDLRGLGSGRNLVLMDGRRAMGSTSAGTVDINTIPSALIDRVEIITGGAGATYGPDAVSGVVNFIMKKDFEGMAINTQYRETAEGDGVEWGADLTLGGTFMDGRGSAVFNGSYFNRDAIYKGARSFSAQASGATSIFPGGSWTPGAAAPSQAAVDALFGPNKCNSNGGSAGFGFNPDGSLFCTGVSGNSARNAVGYTGPDSDIATAFYPDFFSYNFEPANILVLPMERWNMYSSFEVDVSEHFQPYGRFTFTNYNALQELAPTPAGGTTGFTVPVTNPFLTPQIKTLLATRANPTAPFAFAKRFNSLGGRTGFNTHDVMQVVTGTRGLITGSWNYNVYASYGRSTNNEVQGGNVRRDRTQALLDAADGGASLCAGGLNMFGAAAISSACQAYISLEAKNLTTIEQEIIEGTVTGNLFEIPAGMVQAAFGLGARSLSYDFKPDGGLQPGLVAGFNQQLPVTGELEFKDIFGEIIVPLLNDLPMVDSLSFTGGYRVTDSKRSGSDDTWKATLDWNINDMVRARGGYQHAVRTPSINELFAPQLNNFPTFTNQDPCNTTGTLAATYRNGPNGAQVTALCNAQSVVAGLPTYFQPSSQATGITGGNPNLRPETADSYTLGAVIGGFENRLLERSTFTVDYWSIELEDVISSVAATTIVQRCFNRDNANPTYSPNNEWCQLFIREPTNGGVIDLKQLSRNQSFTNTSGVDFSGNIGFDLSNNWGSLNLSMVSTWIEKFESQTTIVDPVNDFAGTISSGTGGSTPEWRHTITPTWSRGPAQAQITARYIDEMVHANTVTGGSPTANTGTKATWYYDLTGRYDIMEGVTIRGGVNNVTDQQPRIYTPNVQANTDPSMFDVLGRRYFVGFDIRF
ncbi:MAG: TonB-dependent receptor [Pseudohongiella sp.]|nr:TonB-dependent receptor [Pseudohongiella sp.]